MQHPIHGRRRSFAQSPRRLFLPPALLALAGCSSDAMSLGSNEVAVEDSECRAPIEGDIVASNQADIEALRGCRELPGSLRIAIPRWSTETISLEPLAQLRRVSGPLQISGPFSTLAGLESLESVGVLELRGTEVRDLLPLRGLTRVDTPADWQVSSIQIVDCDQLRDLRGLENLAVWGSLQIIQNDGLVSLQGLQAPEHIEFLRLIYSPNISDVSALATVRSAGFFDLTGTAITSLDGFALERADTLNLSGNSALINLDGLSRLERVGVLNVIGNDGLVRMDLPQLRTYESIRIGENDVLTSLLEPQAGWATEGDTIGPDGAQLGFSRGTFTVYGNTALTSAVLSDPYDFESIIFSQNAALTTLNVPNVSRADAIWIQDNPVLVNVTVPTLRQVGKLTILDNPALSVAPFAGVQTFDTEVMGNLDALP
jgi:hypothetical protein